MPKGGLSGHGHQRIIKAFRKAGWQLIQGGNHAKLVHPTRPEILVVPRHDPVKPFLLKSLIKLASLDETEFLKLL